MTNEELSKIILPQINNLRELNQEALSIARDIIGKTLLKTDLYFCSLLNKSVQLTDGFIELIQNRNLTCAAILLRSSMDNCMRLYAMYIAKDPNKVVDYLIEGKRIDCLTDKKGNKLKDFYLKKELSKYDNNFKAVYNNASGYVHFSEKGFYQSVSASSGKYHIAVQVSHEVPEKVNGIILECVQAYIYFLKLFYTMFSDIIRVKKEYDQMDEKGV